MPPPQRLPVIASKGFNVISSLDRWFTDQATGMHVILIMAALGIVAFVDDAHVPIGVKVIAWACDISLFVMLFRVDWKLYWHEKSQNLPKWFAATISFLGFLNTVTIVVMVCMLVLCAFIPRHAGRTSAFDDLLSSAVWSSTNWMELCGLVTLLSFCTVCVAAVYRRTSKPDGRRMVEEQDVHGSADFASAASIDSALRGLSATASTPPKFDD
jgi:hypothetical protein